MTESDVCGRQTLMYKNGPRTEIIQIATAIRGLYWMKMTMVNSGLKGLNFMIFSNCGM